MRNKKNIHGDKFTVIVIIIFFVLYFGVAFAQQFSPYQINPFGLTDIPINGSSTTAFADLDGDGDFDMMSGSEDNFFVYFQNIGAANSPSFAAYQINPFGLTDIPVNGSSTTAFADLDGDGDFDMMSGSEDNFFVYYQNIGTANSPSFTAFQINPFGLTDIPVNGSSTTAFADLDGDGDFDMMSGSEDNFFVYYQNIGTANTPSFAAYQENPFELTDIPVNGSSTTAFADLDGDGDFDMMSGSEDNFFVYYQNIGTANSPSFAAYQKNPFGLTDIPVNGSSTTAFADLDGDGDFDMMSGSEDNFFVYYQNTFSTSIFEVADTQMYMIVYPNPTTGRFTVSLKSNEAMGIEILCSNLLGQFIFLKKYNLVNGELITELDLSAVGKGLYLVQVYSNNKSIFRKVTIIE